MRIIQRILSVAILLTASLMPFAAQSAPPECDASSEGTIIYNAQHKLVQFCNGDKWIGMVAKLGSTGDTLGDLSCTSGEIPKWNGTLWDCAADDAGSSSVWLNDGPGGTSKIYYNAGAVGIGTNNPSGAALHIANGSVPLTLSETDQTGAGSLWRMPLDNLRIRFDVSQDGTTFTPYVTPLSMQSNGNVSIGSSADATTRLHVHGTLRVGDGAELCNATWHEGAIRYVAATDAFQMCRSSSTGWETLGAGSGSGGISGRVAAAGTCTLCNGATSSRIGTGEYQITFTTAQANADYAISLSTETGDSTSGGPGRFINYHTPTTTGFRVTIQDSGGTSNSDRPFNFVIGAGGGAGDGDTLADLSCTNGQIPKYNGTVWECAAEGAGSSPIWLNDGPGGPAEVYYNGGAVGIGTNDPSTKFEVVGDAIRVTHGYQFNDANAQDGSKWAMYGWDDRITFSLRNADWSYASELMSLKATGNLGIGTIDPQTRLDISGTLRIGDGSELCNATAHEGAIRYVAATDAFQMCRSASNGWETLGAGSSGGSGDVEYLHIKGYQTNATTGSRIPFNTEISKIGTSAALNTSTGIITLQPGKTYRLTGQIRIDTSSGTNSYWDGGWYNLTSNSAIGTLLARGSWNSTASWSDLPLAFAYITPTVVTQVELRSTVASSGVDVDGHAWVDVLSGGGSGGAGDGDTLAELSCASGQIAKWNGTVWECAADGGGGQGTDISFMARSSLGQSIPNTTGTYIQFNQETFDVGNSFTSNRFQPSVAGKYILTANGGFDGLGSSGESFIEIHKNGSSYAWGTRGQQSITYSHVSTIVDANGTSDYFQVYIYQSSGRARNLVVDPERVYFSGALITGGGSGSGTDTLAGLTCSNGQIPKYNGTVWECAADNNSGGGGSGNPIIDELVSSGKETVSPVTIAATGDKWPDFILCQNDLNNTVVLQLYTYGDTSGTAIAQYLSEDNEYYFNLNGTYSSRASVAANCGAPAADINSICNDGRCGFYGGGGGGAMPALPSSQIFVGNASNAATAVALSGDATISNAGVLSLENNIIRSAHIEDDAVSSADLADDAVTIPKLSATGTADATTYLRGDGQWAAISGGDNLGDHNATQSVRFHGAAGSAGGLTPGLETDPQVGILTNNKWCSSNGTQVNCDQDAPSSSLPSLSSANIWIGDGSNVATAVTMSGDGVLTNAGVLTLTANSVTSAEISDGAVTGADIANTTIAVGKLSATGTPSTTTFLRGDGAWATPSGGGGIVGWERRTNTTSATIMTVSCTAGKKVLGGGCLADIDDGQWVASSYPISDTVWQCNFRASPNNTAYVICATIP